MRQKKRVMGLVSSGAILLAAAAAWKALGRPKRQKYLRIRPVVLG